MSANRNIYIVGLTGGIASGKSEAARFLEEAGAHTLDADAISHALTAPEAPMLKDIREVFGDGVFNEDGTLNRAALAEIVFSDPEMRRRLDGLIHPAVQKAMLDEVETAEKNGEKLVFLNVPLLFETGMDTLCDETWLVSASEDTQLKRLTERDGVTIEQASARINSQMRLEDKIARANVVIENNRTLEKLKNEVQSLYSSLLKKIN